MRPRPLARRILVLALPVVAELAPPAPAADGDLDLDFGIGGSFRWAAPDGVAVGDVLVAPDGAIVVVGGYRDDQADPTWQLHWKRFTDDAAGTSCVATEPGADSVVSAAAAFDSSGRLVVAASGSNGFGGTALHAARFLYPSCSLDTTFGGDGYVRFAENVFEGMSIHDVRLVRVLVPPAFLVDRILVGAKGAPDGAPVGEAVVYRLTPAGALDGAFGGGTGRVYWPEGAVSAIGEVALAPDNRPLAVGEDASDFWVTRRMASGAPDTSFGGDGVASVAFDRVPNGVDAGRVIALAPDGGVVVAGTAYSRPYSGSGDWDGHLAIARLLPNGALDPAFGGPVLPGRVLLDLDAGAPDRLSVGGVLVQGDGKSLVVGAIGAAGDQEMFAVRLDATGALDSTFAGDGVALFPIDLGDTLDDGARAVTLQSGRAVLAGEADHALSVRGVVLRLENSLIFADGFDSGGSSRWST